MTRLNSTGKIIAHQMIQDPLTVSHQQREKRMFDGELNTQRKKQHLSDAVSFPSWLEHCFHLHHWMQEYPNACHCIPGVLVHTFLSGHSDVTVKLFESDTRVIERARLRVHSTSRRFHNGCHAQRDR